MTAPTLSLQYQNDPELDSWNVLSNDSDLVYPIFFSYGITNNAPGGAHIASAGTMQIFWDNLGSTLPYTDTNSVYAGGKPTGIGARYALRITNDTDTTYLFTGVVTEWNAVPGLFDERVTEVIVQDYMWELGRYPVNMLEVHKSSTAETLMSRIVNSTPLSTTDMMPYPMSAVDYSTDGEAFTLAFHDLVDGSTKAISAMAKIAASEMGHIWTEGEDAGQRAMYYLTHTDWINRGRGSIGTLDNRYLDLDIGKSHRLEYAPIFLNYTPAETAASAVVMAERQNDLTVKQGESDTLRLNYRDPNNKDVRVTALDTDVTAPASGTDYIFTGPTSSDVSVTFSNYGSAGEYTLDNTAGTADAVFTTLQVRGKPIYIYDDVVLTSSDGSPSAETLRVNMPYLDNNDFAHDVMTFYKRLYSRYPDESVATSVSFEATADSDILSMAMQGKVGKSFRLIEDVTRTDNYYRITSVTWDIYAPEHIVVTWGILSSEYTALHMVDSDGDHMVDSDGNRFAFWR